MVSLEQLDKILADRKIPFTTRKDILLEVGDRSDAERRMANHIRDSLNAEAAQNQKAYIAGVLAMCARFGIKITSPVDVHTLDKMLAESSHPEMNLQLRWSLKSALNSIGYISR